MRKRDQKFQEAFGRHIRKLREDRRWTQIDLAVVSRIHESQISKIENGQFGPNLQTIRVLAFALGKLPAQLFNFEYDFRLNTEFNVSNKSGNRPKTTKVINELTKGNFFKTPRSVADVIAQCKKESGVDLESADTSGALLRLVRGKVLKRTQGATKSKFAYQKV